MKLDPRIFTVHDSENYHIQMFSDPIIQFQKYIKEGFERVGTLSLYLKSSLVKINSCLHNERFNSRIW